MTDSPGGKSALPGQSRTNQLPNDSKMQCYCQAIFWKVGAWWNFHIFESLTFDTPCGKL
jgi:hypothetical protein